MSKVLPLDRRWTLAAVASLVVACGTSDHADTAGAGQDAGASGGKSTGSPASGGVDASTGTGVIADGGGGAPRGGTDAGPDDAGSGLPVLGSVGPTTLLPASALRERIGFAVNINLSSSIVAQIATAMSSMHVTLVRSEITTQGEIDNLIALGKMVPGLRVDALVLAYPFIPLTWAQQQPLLLQLYQAGILESIEGPNEINLFGVHGVSDTTGATTAAQTSADFLAWAQAMRTFRDANMPGVLLYSPTIGLSTLQTVEMNGANVSAIVDAASCHYYPGYQHQFSGAGGYITSAETWCLTPLLGSASAPLVITEMGVPASTVPQGYDVLDYLSSAKIGINGIMDVLATNVQRGMFYRLWDSGPDPANDAGAESHYGWFANDWTPKTGATALAVLGALLADPDTGFVPQPLDVSFAGFDSTAGAAGTHIVFRRSDGTDLVVVWNEPSTYGELDSGAYGYEAPAPLSVTATWTGARSYQVIDPVSGSTPIATGSGTSATLSLVGSVQVIVLKAGG